MHPTRGHVVYRNTTINTEPSMFVSRSFLKIVCHLVPVEIKIYGSGSNQIHKIDIPHLEVNFRNEFVSGWLVIPRNEPNQ